MLAQFSVINHNYLHLKPCNHKCLHIESTDDGRIMKNKVYLNDVYFMASFSKNHVVYCM